MRALTVSPAVPNSMRLDEAPEPPASDGDVVIETPAVGAYSLAPDGPDRLIIGHESLGRVLDFAM